MTNELSDIANFRHRTRRDVLIGLPVILLGASEGELLPLLPYRWQSA
jgi:hypothetical protein